MSELWPIYIPSRGRPGKAGTMKQVPQATLVVEPQEWEAYAAHYPAAQVATLPESGKGIGYARQQIKEMATRAGHPWYWMMDDDLGRFVKFDAPSTRCCPAEEALGYAQDEATRYEDVAMVGLQWRQILWREPAPIRFGYQMTQVVALHTGRTRAMSYRGRLLEDADFLLQVLSGGYSTMLVTWYGKSDSAAMTSPGGCMDDYQNPANLAIQADFCRRWPGLAKPNEKRPPYVRIRWRQFARPEWRARELNARARWGK